MALPPEFAAEQLWAFCRDNFGRPSFLHLEAGERQRKLLSTVQKGNLADHLDDPDANHLFSPQENPARHGRQSLGRTSVPLRLALLFVQLGSRGHLFRFGVQPGHVHLKLAGEVGRRRVDGEDMFDGDLHEHRLGTNPWVEDLRLALHEGLVPRNSA